MGGPTEELWQVIYLSSSVRELSEDEFIELCATFARRNNRYGVTGLLLYDAGTFLQVIEGNKEVIRDLFGRITEDERHTGLIALVNDAISEREFRFWGMAARHLSSGKHQNIVELSGDMGERFLGELPGSRARHLLRRYRDEMLSGAYRGSAKAKQ